MKKHVLIFLLASFLLSCSNKIESGYSHDIEYKIDSVISAMSLEEKVGQMTQITLDVLLDSSEVKSDKKLMLDEKKLDLVLRKYKVGSILNSPQSTPLNRERWVELTLELNRIAKEETGIPLIYGIDAIHGVSYTAASTFFPQQIGLGATFNKNIVKQAGEITAYETRASNIPWNFSPVLGIGIDPRWPRFWETFGEDPFVCSELGKSMIYGYQGDLDSTEMENTKVIACAKHFYAYTYPKSGKDRTSAWIPENYLREYFLPPFEEAVKNDVQTFMINSGEINGVPVHMNKQILTDLLKDELKFEGFTVSDWADIIYLEKRYRIVDNEKEAVKLAINAGIDMSMTPYTLDFADHLTELVNEGEVKMERINDAVRRILRVKFKAGLFNENKYNGEEKYALFNSPEFINQAKDAAAESITLLENKNDILPLKKGVKILVTGPNANTVRPLNGGWSYSWQGDKSIEYTDKYNTILEAVENIAGKENVKFLQGVQYFEREVFNPLKEDSIIDINKLKNASENVDVILLAIGENSYTETPGDLYDLRISKNQAKLARMAIETGKPVIVVLNEGRPRVISEFIDGAQAVLQTYLPGNYGADALAEILFGKINPSGKLPYTYPKYVNHLLPYYHKTSDQAEADVNARLGRFKPQYEFGHGLSYTRFEYSNLQLQAEEGLLKISVEISNTGNRDGKESALLFVSDKFASISPDVKRLRAFEKVFIKAGDKKKISFGITGDNVSFINHDLEKIYEEGEFEIAVDKLRASVHLDEKGSWVIMEK